MRTSRLSAAFGFLAIAPLMSVLAACDEAQESTSITEVSPMGEAAVVAGTAPEAGLADPATSPSEGEAATARQDATSADDAATPASRRAASPSSRPTATPAAPAMRTQPASEATQPADPHSGHDMSSMGDHDMEGM
tara:strand:+ start:231 stop:638 length:408 start_codon:yes stop_codon:yes gene_type:complete